MTDFAPSGRARIAYEVAGEGPDVLLIHAGVNDRRSWRAVIERLSARHRCIAYDKRGFGETEYELQDGWSPVDDALAVLDAAGCRAAVVVGASMGGRDAIDLALAHPQRVSGLVLIGPAGRGCPEPEESETDRVFISRYEAAEEAGDVDEMNRLEAWFWLDGPEAAEGRVGGAARELFLEMNGRALRADDPGEEADLPEAWPRLGEIAVQALLLAGSLDAHDVVSRTREAAGRIPGARFELLDGVAHVPHLEGDAATLDAIDAFVSRRARSG